MVICENCGKETVEVVVVHREDDGKEIDEGIFCTNCRMMLSSDNIEVYHK